MTKIGLRLLIAVRRPTPGQMMIVTVLAGMLIAAGIIALGGRWIAQ